MKPHPRIRKTIKWAGAAVTVLLVVVWIGSGWCVVSRTQTFGPDAGAACAVRHGVVALEHSSLDRAMLNLPQMVSAWDAGVGDFHFLLTPRWVNRGSPKFGHLRILELPLWPLVLATLTATLISHRLDTLARRRAKLNLCPKCHYDRAGLAAGAACPECGTVFTIA